MGILDWLFRRKDVKGRSATKTETQRKVTAHPRNRELNLEGTRFLLFTAEAGFFDKCRQSGQAALVLPFADYWPTSSRGYQAKATGGGTRLLCGSCLVDMAMSFQMSLPGGMMGGGGMIAIGEGLPGNLFDAAKAARCPHCGSDSGILLWDHPNYGEITEHDMEALRELWHFRCQLWWSRNDRSEGICDRCSSNRIPRGEGYHRGSDVICEECAMKATDSEALSELRKNPDYFGTSELRRARSFKSSGWRLEPGTIVNSA